MKVLTIGAVGSLSTLSAGVSIAQSGNMMDGSDGWMGGHGGVWGPIVLVVIAALIGWAVLQRRK